MDKVSIIIPTYNRFKYLIYNLQFIKKQTYSNFEIIIINDGSTEKEYYTHNWENEGVSIIHLPENTKKKFGYGCVGYVRNIGIEKSSGKYIAFCDDDDTWLQNKLELQRNRLKHRFYNQIVAFFKFILSKKLHIKSQKQSNKENNDAKA